MQLGSVDFGCCVVVAIASRALFDVVHIGVATSSSLQVGPLVVFTTG